MKEKFSGIGAACPFSGRRRDEEKPEFSKNRFRLIRAAEGE